MTTSTDHTARAGAAPSGTRVRYRSDVSLVSMLAGEVRIVGPKDETGGAEMLDEAGTSMDYRNAAQLEGDEFWGDFELVAAAPTEGEPSVQPPTREQIAEAWEQGFADGRRCDAEGEDGPRFTNPYRDDLFPQPTPSAEQEFRWRVQALRDEMFAELDSPDHLVPLDSLVERMDALLAENVPPAKPVRMTQGMTFTAHPPARQFIYRGGGTYRDESTGVHVSANAFDPSTIRDVRESRQ